MDAVEREQFLRDRAGSLGASQVALALAKTKTGWGASRADVMSRLIAERLTGEPMDSYQSIDMLRGIEREPEAIVTYEFQSDNEVQPSELVRHPRIDGTHASPDGFIGDDGLLEVKSPKVSTHIETLITGKIPDKYIVQMLWQMACTGRKWCDHVSYNPDMPPSMQLWIKRIERDDKRIAQLEADVETFLEELENKVIQLRNQYEQQKAA